MSSPLPCVHVCFKNQKKMPKAHWVKTETSCSCLLGPLSCQRLPLGQVLPFYPSFITKGVPRMDGHVLAYQTCMEGLLVFFLTHARVVILACEKCMVPFSFPVKWAVLPFYFLCVFVLREIKMAELPPGSKNSPFFCMLSPSLL